MIGTWKLDSTFDGLGPGSLDLPVIEGFGIGLITLFFQNPSYLRQSLT